MNVKRNEKGVGNTATAVEGRNQSYWKPFSNKSQKSPEKPWVFANPAYEATFCHKFLLQIQQMYKNWKKPFYYEVAELSPESSALICQNSRSGHLKDIIFKI